MRPLIERIRALPWPKPGPIPPGGIRPSELNAIPIEKVPKRIREALPHPAPYNTCWDEEYVYELTYKYLWRQKVADIRAKQNELLERLEDLQQARGLSPT